MNKTKVNREDLELSKHSNDNAFARTLRDSMTKQIEDLYNGLKAKIWQYMKEHPTEDKVYKCIISPETHFLVLEDVGYEHDYRKDEDILYAKRFHFEHKWSRGIHYEPCQPMIDHYEDKLKELGL